MTRKEFFGLFLLPFALPFIKKGTPIEVTRVEGGTWEKHRLFMSEEQITEELRKNCSYEIVKVYPSRYPVHFSTVGHHSALPGIGVVHSVRFADGDIWDPSFGCFRHEAPFTVMFREGKPVTLSGKKARLFRKMVPWQN